MKGEIQRLMEKKGRSGAKYWLLDIDGTFFSTAERAQIEGLNEGDTVQVQWKKVGGYNNITSIRKVENLQDIKNRQIVRMSCLSTAAMVAASTGLQPMKKLRLTLKAAKEFERYVRLEDGLE